MQSAVRISDGDLSRRLRRLRRAGIARRVTLYDPCACGRPVTYIVRVALGGYAPERIARFEGALREDPMVLRASVVTGAFDYQLFCAFPDLRVSNDWLRGLEYDHALARIRADRVLPRWGALMSDYVVG